MHPTRHLVHGLCVAVALLSGCGSSGDDNSPPSGSAPPAAPTPPAPPAPPGTSSYDVASHIAAIRAHPSYGSVFTDTRNPDAPQGLVLPTPPQPGCMANRVTVSSLAQFNSEAAGVCKRITLAPSATAYAGVAQITGQDIEAVFSGTVITPTDDSWALQITLDARRVKTVGGTFNNLYVVGGNRPSPTGSQPNTVQDIHIQGASFTGLYTQGLSSTYYTDGASVRAHRFLLERVSARSANGAFFLEGGSNVIMANSNIVVPKLALRHENPVRANGADLVVVIDSRLRTELGPGQSGPIKHTWRMHAGYDGAGTPGGRMLVKRVQSEGGGASAQYPGVESPHTQSTQLVIDGWRYYRAPDVEGNNIASFPHLNTYAGSAHLGSVMNAWLWMGDNIVYFNDQAAGTSFMGGNTPPGSVSGSVYAPYVAPPVWDFR